MFFHIEWMAMSMRILKKIEELSESPMFPSLSEKSLGACGSTHLG
jgi:hypothetical protein